MRRVLKRLIAARGTPGAFPRPVREEIYPRLFIRHLEQRRVLAVDGVTAVAAQIDVDEGQLIDTSLATFTDDASGNTNEPHTATIDWDDGSSSMGGIVEPKPNSDGTVSGMHTYADNGTFTVTVTVTGQDNSSLSDTFTVNVANVAPSVAADNATVTVDEGQTATNTGTFSDPGADTVTITASIGTITQNAGTWSWSFDSTDGPDESQTVTITAEDDDGAQSTITFDLVVNNVAPSVAADNATVTVDEGQTATNTGTFSDPGADTVTITASVGSVTQTAGAWSWSFATTDEIGRASCRERVC